MTRPQDLAQTEKDAVADIEFLVRGLASPGANLVQQERHPQRPPSGSVVYAIMADDWTPTCGFCLGT
jgi:hypothetical protein